VTQDEKINELTETVELQATAIAHLTSQVETLVDLALATVACHQANQAAIAYLATKLSFVGAEPSSESFVN